MKIIIGKDGRNYLTMSIRFNIKSLPDIYKKLFVADGCIELPKPIRSPFHDYEEKRRRGNRRDFLCNIWGVPLGASDTVFDHIILNKIKETTIRQPDYSGEVVFDYEKDKVVNQKFVPNFGKQRLSWWGALFGGRPDQSHNFILACDISFGLGSSNSIFIIYDCNTKEQVGEWADSMTPQDKFADIAVATARWTGGQLPCFLIWENNGSQGSTFRQRVLYQDYYNVYISKKEEAKYRKKSDTYGWRANETNKGNLISDLGTALSCGINDVDDFISIKIHSKDLLDELYDYVWYEGGGCGTSATQDMKTGARKRHGDRVIPVGLCILATRDQPKGAGTRPIPVLANSFIGRFQAWLNKEEQIQKEGKIWLY